MERLRQRMANPAVMRAFGHRSLTERALRAWSSDRHLRGEERRSAVSEETGGSRTGSAGGRRGRAAPASGPERVSNPILERLEGSARAHEGEKVRMAFGAGRSPEAFGGLPAPQDRHAWPEQPFRRIYDKAA